MEQKIFSYKQVLEGLTAYFGDRAEAEEVIREHLADQSLDLESLQEEFNKLVVEIRPQVLEADVVRFQNNKEKWVALIGLIDGHPYEIFTGIVDEEEGLVLPKSVNKGRIIKNYLPDGTRRYDFQFENKRGYKTTVEGLSEKFNPEYWNYAKLISGVLRYRMPIENVIKLVSSLQLSNQNINAWKSGVQKALKRYTRDWNENNDSPDTSDSSDTDYDVQ